MLTSTALAKHLGVATTGTIQQIDISPAAKPDDDTATHEGAATAPPAVKEMLARSVPTDQVGSLRLSSGGWVPAHYGAWPTAMLPYMAGILLSGPRWAHLVVLALWTVAYLAFQAAGLWLRSGKQHRFWVPARTYALVAVPLSIFAVATTPFIMEWAAVLTPLAILAAYQSYHYAQRTIITRTATCLTCALMQLVAYDVGTNFARPAWVFDWLHHSAGNSSQAIAAAKPNLVDWNYAVITASIMFLSLLCMVAYARTLSEDGRELRFFYPSLLLHAVLAFTLVGLWGIGFLGFFAALVGVIIFCRGALAPWIAPHITNRQFYQMLLSFDTSLLILLILGLLPTLP